MITKISVAFTATYIVNIYIYIYSTVSYIVHYYYYNELIDLK